MSDDKETKQIRVLIADDHDLIRDGLCSLLELESDIDVIAVAEDGADAIIKATELMPDVIVMDIRMPKFNGIEATQKIKALFDDMQILCMSVHHEQTIVDSILKAGASGYIVKGNAGTELPTAIRAVAAGDSYFCSTITGD